MGKTGRQGEKGLWLERSWGSSNQLRRAECGSRQLVRVFDVVLFIPMLFLSEEFGVPLLPGVTKKCVCPVGCLETLGR